MLRKHKKYSKPKRPFDKERILEEAQIKKRYGLKNKREIWKTEANVKSIREKAKKLISADEGKKEALYNQLRKIGLNVNSISDVLSLTKEDILKRRLQSVLVKKKLVTTQKSARQLITHKKVLVNNKIVNAPSYMVPVEFEDKISLKLSKAKKEHLETNKLIEDSAEKLPEETGEENA